MDAQCTCSTHTAAVVPGIYPSIEEVHSGTQWLNCHRPSDPSNSGGSPNRAGGRVQQKIEKTRHCSSQAKLQTHARRKSMTVHVLVRVCGTRWPKAQPTPARPDPTTQHTSTGTSTTELSPSKGTSVKPKLYRCVILWDSQLAWDLGGCL